MNLNEEEIAELATYRKIKELQKYAEDFFKQLRDEMLPDIYLEILPIHFHTEDKYFQEGLKSGRFRKGDFDVYKKQAIINIYDVELASMEILKIFIRHELCHYALYISDFNYADNNYKDNTAAFWALASCYDANPYEELIGLQKDLFNKYQFIIKNYKSYMKLCNMPICKDEQNDKLATIYVLIKRISLYNKDPEAKKDFDELYEDVVKTS
jgi:hypothetical protein